MREPELGSQAFWDRLLSSPERLAAEVCFVDVVNLDQTLQHHAALHAWVAAAHEVARIEEEQAKWNVTRTQAEALLTAREEPDPGTGKAKVVDVMKAQAETAPEVQEAVAALLKIGRKRAALRAMDRALEDRKDMLVQLSARQRREQDSYR